MSCLGNITASVVAVGCSVGLHVIVRWGCYMSHLGNITTSVVVVGCGVGLHVIVG